MNAQNVITASLFSALFLTSSLHAMQALEVAEQNRHFQLSLKTFIAAHSLNRENAQKLVPADIAQRIIDEHKYTRIKYINENKQAIQELKEAGKASPFDNDVEYPSPDNMSNREAANLRSESSRNIIHSIPAQKLHDLYYARRGEFPTRDLLDYSDYNLVPSADAKSAVTQFKQTCEKARNEHSKLVDYPITTCLPIIGDDHHKFVVDLTAGSEHNFDTTTMLQGKALELEQASQIITAQLSAEKSRINGWSAPLWCCCCPCMTGVWTYTKLKACYQYCTGSAPVHPQQGQME